MQRVKLYSWLKISDHFKNDLCCTEWLTFHLSAYLISELEAARMLSVNAPPKKAQEGTGSEVFQELKGICIALGMSKPPANITMLQFFSGIEKKVRNKGLNIQ